MEPVAVAWLVLLIVPNGVSSIPTPTPAAYARALRKKIFETDEYAAKLRPAKDQNVPTEVSLSFYLLSINELNEVQETLKTTGFLALEWKDDFLQWNKSEFGGIEQYFFPQDDVWKPDVALKNSFEKQKTLGLSTLNVQVTSTGDVQWYPFEVFESTCPIDSTYFPFDRQKCILTFVAWSYTTNQVHMRSGSKGIDTQLMAENAVWSVVTTAVGREAGGEAGTDEASVIYMLKLERKPRFIMLSMILPILMLAILNLLVFVLPYESGEKASYAVTVFLTFVVFLTILSSVLPTNSDSLSIFSVYIIILTVQSTVITIIDVSVLRLRELGRPVPKSVCWLVNLLHCQGCRSNREKVAPEMHDEAADKQTDGEQYDWKIVADALDRLFFCFFTFVTFISSLVCFIMASERE